MFFFSVSVIDMLCQYPVSLSFFSLIIRPPPTSTLFPYTTLFRSGTTAAERAKAMKHGKLTLEHLARFRARSEEHTSELQSLRHLVCRLLLEKKKKSNTHARHAHVRHTPTAHEPYA